MKKSVIRKKFLHLRKKNYLKNISIDPQKIIKFLEKKKLRNKSIGGYYPFNYEMDILSILNALENKKYIISLPKVGKNNTMDFFHWSVKDPLKINRYGIPETISNKKVYPEILLIPLVAFDNQLNRLGYGGGYYDRYISKHDINNKFTKIGIGFSFQRINNLPTNIYDKKLSCIITEKNIIE